MTRRSTGAELERRRRIEPICEGFEERWRDGGAPCLEDSLATIDPDDTPDLLAELLLLEWTYRRDRGERFELAEYARRFGGHEALVATTWQRWQGETESIVPKTALPVPEMPRQPGGAEALPGGYEEWVFVAEGGMGAVFRARDPRLGRLVAIKKLHALTPSRLLRFRTEAKLLANLMHPHIVQVYSLEEIDRQPCLVMEYVAGGSLEKRLGRKALSATESARLIGVVARAVQAAHDKGIVHRDLKPGNVLMAESVAGSSGNVLGGFPKVSDFGLAKQIGEPGQTGSGEVMGTPHYMAPEQAKGRVREIGPASDVWAMGVMLYRCLTGWLPFVGEDTIETLNKVVSERPAAFAEGAVPAVLEALCLRCLEKEAAKRPSAGELAEALEAFAKEGGSATGSWEPDGAVSVPWDRRPACPDAADRRAAYPTEPTPADAATTTPRRTKRKVGLAVLIGAGALVALVAAVIVYAVTSGPWPTSATVNGTAANHGVKTVTKADRALVKALRVKHWVNDERRPWVEIGNESVSVAFGGDVRIEADFSGPAYAYLIAFNADGKEQLLWPVSERRQFQPDEGAIPEAVAALTFPHPERAKFRADSRPAVFVLDDEEKGGTQAFAVVASRKPLPAYSEWRKERGEARWKREETCIGVWGYGDGKLVTIQARRWTERGGEGGEKGVPALEALGGSLRKGDVEVKAMAFQVKAKGG